MGRPAQHLIGDAERVHDVERQQRDMRRLEHVAAGVEDEIRRVRRARIPPRLLAQPRQQLVVELHLRDVGHLARDLAEALDALAALLARRVVAAPSRPAPSPSRKRGLTP